MINLILVDDHHLVRDGIKALIADETDIQIIGEASTGKELFEVLNKKSPDIIVLDISLPDISGIEITRKIVESYSKIRVLILSMYTNEDYILNALKSGASGYLPKNVNRDELLDAIRAIYSGGEYFSELISNIMIRSYIKKSKEPILLEEKKDVPLTSRETDILKLSAEGYSNQQIAAQFNLSIRTVESHKNHIMQKLKLRSTAEMIKWAIRNKIIDI